MGKGIDLSIEQEKELEIVKHEFKMKQIEAEKQARMEVENLIFENQKSLQRLKRADIRRTIAEKEQFRN